MICSEPLAVLVPDQPPEAVQAVALVELQVSVVPPPATTAVGLAVREAVGAGVVGGGVLPPPASLLHADSIEMAIPTQASLVF